MVAVVRCKYIALASVSTAVDPTQSSEFGSIHFVWPNVKRDPKVVCSSLARTGRDSNRSCLILFDFSSGWPKSLFYLILI